MDWGNDYFTFSDTNIEYVWRMLKQVHEQRLALHRPPLDRVVPALRHVALAARADAVRRLPGRADRRSSSASRCSTVSASRSSSGRRRRGRCRRTSPPQSSRRPSTAGATNGEWVAVARYPDETFEERKRGSELVGWRYRGPFDTLSAAAGVEHRVIAWDEVSLDEGTGIVHIAPGAAAEDFELGRMHDCRC